MKGKITRAAAVVGALACGLSGAGCGRPEPRLLLLITVDTLRADELGAYGSERGLTPHLDALARESIVFEAAYAPAAFTLPSIGAVLTGRYPEELGIRSNESGLPEAVSTLATELSARGWRTGAVVGNFVLRRGSGVDRGFDRFDDHFEQQEAVRHWPERVAASTTDAALAALDECTGSGERCFLWVHYQDPHGPYSPPDSRRERLLEAEREAPDAERELPVGSDQRGIGAIPRYQFVDERRDVAWYRAGYRGEIAYMDEQLGRLLQGVEQRGLGDRALVVFTADHGESLGENDIWFAHGERLGDEQVRVPLMLRGPGLSPGRRTDPASLIDLYPTLLAKVAGVAPDPAGRGRDLLRPDAAEAASRPYLATLGGASRPRYALVEDGFKLVVEPGPEGERVRLYRLGSERVDLSRAAPQVADRMRRRLEEIRQELGTGTPETRQELTRSERERLRALGYESPGP